MKYLLFSFLLVFSASAFSQSADTAVRIQDSVVRTQSPGIVYRVVQVMPEFPGGKDSLASYIKRNVRYPRALREERVQGTVVVEFVVDIDGSIWDPKIKTSANPKLDAEAIRLVKTFPAYNPGKQGGKPVKVISTATVDFKLEKEGAK